MNPGRYNSTCPDSSRSSGLKQFNRIAVGILYLDLLPAGACFHRVPESQACFLHPLDLCGKILHLKHHAIPTSWLLPPAIRHIARTRCAGAAENKLQAGGRNLSEGRQLLEIQLETELLGVKSN